MKYTKKIINSRWGVFYFRHCGLDPQSLQIGVAVGIPGQARDDMSACCETRHLFSVYSVRDKFIRLLSTKTLDLCNWDCFKENTKHTKETKRAENHCPFTKYLFIYVLFAIPLTHVFRVFRVFRVSLFTLAIPIAQVENLCNLSGKTGAVL